MRHQAKALVFGVFSSVVVAGVQGAEATDAAAGAAASSNQLSEVVVTARRRDESLEKVPISVTALGAAQLAARGVNTEADLQAATPGLVIRQTSSQNQLNYSIRGQSVDAFSGSAPGVLPYIDEVQVSTNTATAFYDLQNVQVLKGPQGTLFGRNATGGAVLYETAKPNGEAGGYVKVKVGNFDEHDIEAAVNVPINDVVSLRLAGDYIKSDGYIHNLYDGSWLGGQDQKSGRATLKVTPSDMLSNTTTLQYSDIGGTNAPTPLYSANACGSTNNGITLLSTVACLYNPAFPGFAAFLAAHPKAYPGGIAAFVAYQRSLGPWTTDIDFPAAHHAEAGFFVNNTSYNFADNLTLKNILGITRSHSSEQNDFDGTPYPIFAAGSEAVPKAELFYIRQYSDELRLQGKAFNDALDYQFGTYFSYERDENNYPLVAFDLSPAIPGTPVQYHWDTTDRSKALYAQGTYDFGGGFSITTGGRYTWETNGIEQLEGSIFQGANSQTQSTSKPSWTVSLDYQVTSNLLLYATTRGSWRTGGFNGTSPAINAYASGGGNVFKPETTTDVEAGLKYEGRVADVPVRFNFAAYNQNVKEIQRTAYLILNGNPLAITVNVPEAKISGAEFDAQVRPWTWLELGLSGTYANARFTSPNVTYFGTSLAYGPYGDTPRRSGTVYAQVSRDLGDHEGTLSLRGDLYAQDIMYFSSLNNTINPNTEIPGYHLVNLRADWSKVMGTTLSASIYARNLTNERYYVGGIPQGADLGLNEASPGRPRMYGLELRYDF